MATQPAVRAVQLTKHYPGPRGREAGRKSALEGVSFDIAAGEMVGLLGPNGAGKTTLLKVLATLLFPSSGEVHFGDINVLREPGRARKRLGLVTCDERSFYWRLTGRHNLEFFAALYHVPSRETPARVQELLEVLGLAEAADRPFHGYSAGMKQKLAIARGLLASPEILL